MITKKSQSSFRALQTAPDGRDKFLRDAPTHISYVKKTRGQSELLRSLPIFLRERPWLWKRGANFLQQRFGKFSYNRKNENFALATGEGGVGSWNLLCEYLENIYKIKK